MDLRKKGADKTHLTEICNNLNKLGNEVLLVAPAYTPFEKIKTDFPVHYIRVGKKSYLSYLDFHLKLQFSFNKILNNFKPHVVYSRDIQNSFLLFKIAKKHNIPYIIEKNTIAPDELASRRFNKVFVKANEILENLNVKKCDGIVAVTKGIQEELIKRYSVSRKKIIILTNGANHQLFLPMDQKSIRKELGLDTSYFIVGFTGSFAPWQGLDLLVEAANIIIRQNQHTNIKFLLVGDGETKSKILNMIKNYNLNSYFILPGRVNYEEIPKYINASDVVVVIKSKLRGIKYFSPLKFFEYAFCGVPIIFSKNIIGEEINEFKNKLGYEIGDDSPEELAIAILNAYKNSSILKENIRSIRDNLVANYSWLSVANKLERFLRNKIQEP
jgi:glycosyltransferase involved in cell wall biosynthesis